MFQFVCTSSVSTIAVLAYQQQSVATACAAVAHAMLSLTVKVICRGCSALFLSVKGIQKLDLSDTVVRDDAMQAVAQLSNLNNLNLAYSGISLPCTTRPVEDSSCVCGAQHLELTSLLHQLCCVTITISHSAHPSGVAMPERATLSRNLTLYPEHTKLSCTYSLASA